MSVEHPTLLCDKDEILQVAGTNKTDYINKAISFEIEKNNCRSQGYFI